MRTFTIEIRTPEECDRDDISRIDIVDDQGRRCLGLGWDELIGQVVSLTHPKLGEVPTYAMKTAIEWQAEREERRQRFEAKRAAEALRDVPF
jgi:hypothetical protein